MSNSLKVFAFLIVMVMLLAACGGSTTTQEPATAVLPAATEAVAAETAVDPPRHDQPNFRQRCLVFDPVCASRRARKIPRHSPGRDF